MSLMSLPLIETLNLRDPSSISSTPVSSNPSSPSGPYLPPPRTNDRPNKLTHYSKMQSPPMVPLNKPIEPPCYYLAGYVLSNEVALKLRHAPSDADIRVWQLDGVLYPFAHCIQEWIQKDLWRERAGFKVDVELIGPEAPFETIFATQGGYALGGSPPPEAVERKLEEIVREWLQDKGISPHEYQWGVRKPCYDT